MIDTTVAAGTANLMAEGVRLLNFWRLADSDIGHVSAALGMLDLAPGARVVDLGSGTGAFARVAGELRPDLWFTLVNTNEWQLDQSPATADTLLADMADTGLPSGEFDAVVLAYALGHGDVVAVLEEAHRLLAPGGRVFLHDIFAPDHGVAACVLKVLNYKAHSEKNLRVWANIIGFDVVTQALDTVMSPGSIVQSVRPLLDTLGHGAAVLQKSDQPHRFAGRRVALNFSGGKDSLACLYLLRPFLEKYISVYWLNTGDGCPETLEVLQQVRQWVPHFIEVRSDVKAWRAVNGMPSDLVPAKGHAIAGLYGMSDTKVSNRFDCCYANLMLPMHQRMVADGINMVIRGTKVSDTGRVPVVGWAGHYEVVLPVMDWSHTEVFDYLEAVGAPKNAIYEHFKGISAPECMGCTAWWDDGKAGYLKARHPDELPRYRNQLQTIKRMLKSHIDDLDAELS